MLNKSDFYITNDTDTTIVNEINGVPFITFNKLSKAGVKHGFSTKLGGVSKEHLSSMNLSFDRGDDVKNVVKNYKRMSDAIGFDFDGLVLTDQQHKTAIRKVSKADAGKGIVKPRDYECIDGLVTDEKGLTLVTIYADCVPLFFYDPVKEVIGTAHSGWRGTVGKIGKCMVEKMKDEYGSKASDIICAIGPCICQSCYEVSQDVYDEFDECFEKSELEKVFQDDHNGKYHLDLWKANELILIDAGILPENLDVTDICTCCNSDIMFSHRATNGKRGNLGAFISI